jgi:enoyl-CoA hydratase/carnithine racemase
MTEAERKERNAVATAHALSCDELAIEIAGPVATITMHRPQVMNAFDRAQRHRLDEALRALDASDDVRVLVITGRGRAFCAGQDQHESAAMDAAASGRRIDDYMALYRTLRALRKPIIARVNGVAAGAGLQIALMCDLRIGSTAARIGMTELKVGSVAVTGSFLLQAHVGEAVMRRLVLLAEVLDARQSLELGLLHEVHAETALDERIAALGEQLAALPPGPLGLTKQWWSAMSEQGFEAAAAAAKAAHASNFASGTYSAGAQRFTRRTAG